MAFTSYRLIACHQQHNEIANLRFPRGFRRNFHQTALKYNVLRARQKKNWLLRFSTAHNSPRKHNTTQTHSKTNTYTLHNDVPTHTTAETGRETTEEDEAHQKPPPENRSPPTIPPRHDHNATITPSCHQYAQSPQP